VTLRVEHAGLSDPGRVRDRNEDSWMADPRRGLYIVSDGIGGELAGDVASRAVVEALPGLVTRSLGEAPDPGAVETLQHVKEAICELSGQIRDQTRHEPGLEGMGATVVLALVRGACAVIAYLGDSRAYRLREGRLEQLTQDHTIVRLLVDRGEIAPDEAAAHPSRGQLTRAVGMEGECLPESARIDLQSGDRLLLCTDGLVDMLSDEEVGSILGDRAPPASTCRRLVDAANAAGGKDNITAVVLDISNPPQGHAVDAPGEALRKTTKIGVDPA